MTALKLSEAIELGRCLEPPGSPLNFKGCAIGLGMAAVGVARKTRTPSKARELWPWVGQVSRTKWFGLTTATHMQDIGDWYFNFRLGRMTMAELVRRVRAVEPHTPTRATVSADASSDRAQLQI